MAVRGGGGAVSASIRRRRARCLHRPPPAAPHRRSDGAPASPLRYSALRACRTLRETRKARSASLAMRNDSSTLSASVTSSGSSGLVTTNPPSSAGVSVSTSFPSETVYDLATYRACRKSHHDDAIDATDTSPRRLID